MNSGDIAIYLIIGLLAHGWGDYIIQTDHMAIEKTKRWGPAVTHALTYTVAFVPVIVLAAQWSLWGSLTGLAIVGGTHAVIDRYRLARHLIWLKNYIGGERTPWSRCQATGFPPDRPVWLTTWLMIIVDNIIHMTINSLVIICLASRGYA